MPKAYTRGTKPQLNQTHYRVLKGLLEADNDATLPQLATRLQARTGMEVSLVFLDETGGNLAMVNLYARAQKGHRAYAKQPKAQGKNISIVGVMTLNAGFLSGLSFEGGLNGDLFLWFVETVLCPFLWPGAVVVMDNLSAHKVEGVQAAIEAIGASPPIRPISIRLKIYGPN